MEDRTAQEVTQRYGTGGITRLKGTGQGLYRRNNFNISVRVVGRESDTGIGTSGTLRVQGAESHTRRC